MDTDQRHPGVQGNTDELDPQKRRSGVETPSANLIADDVDDTGSRLMLRLIPIVHGVVVGIAIDDILIGVLAGFALSAVLDIFTGDDSVIRWLVQRVARLGCPVAARAVRRLAVQAANRRLPVPSGLRDWHCFVSNTPP
jgi:hypothetical protein